MLCGWWYDALSLPVLLDGFIAPKHDLGYASARFDVIVGLFILIYFIKIGGIYWGLADRAPLLWC